MHLSSVTLHVEQYPTEEHYPFCLPVFRRTERIPFEAPVTFFVGENGTGKSTLLEAVATRAGIHIWRDEERRRVVRNPYEKKLCEHIFAEWAAGPVPGSFFGSDIFRFFAAVLDEWAATDPGQLDYFGGQSLLTLSHGQSLMSYCRARYRLKGLYLLDEPETALSPKSQLQLLQLLGEYGSAGVAQFVVATHSPIVLACPGATIYSFDEAPIRPIAYEDTEHYRVYRDFMRDPLRHLPGSPPGPQASEDAASNESDTR